jgi:hypothetical protein
MASALSRTVGNKTENCIYKCSLQSKCSEQEFPPESIIHQISVVDGVKRSATKRPTELDFRYRWEGLPSSSPRPGQLRGLLNINRPPDPGLKLSEREAAYIDLLETEFTSAMRFHGTTSRSYGRRLTMPLPLTSDSLSMSKWNRVITCKSNQNIILMRQRQVSFFFFFVAVPLARPIECALH